MKPALPACAALLLTTSLLAGCIPATPPRQGRPPPARPMPRAPVRRPAPPTRTVHRVAPPAWETQPVVADAATVRAASHVVAPGDTLRAIGTRFGAGAEAIARANGLSPPYVLRPGQRLTIPGGRYHLVRPGQTGIAIARAYGVAWRRVIAVNGLPAPYALRNGQRLLIPDSAPMTLAERAAAFKLDIDDILTGGEPALAERGQPAEASPSPTRVLAATMALAEPRRLMGGFTWPAQGRILKGFGPGATGERNDGLEIAVPLGTPVHAAADGVVAYVGSDIQSLGGLVILKHGDGWTSVYGHAGDLLVQRGQAVHKGQTIALSGDSGATDRPALHFELRQGRDPIDPLTRLPAR